MEVEHGDDSDPELLKFTWEAISQTANLLRIQIYFENPKYLSANMEREWLRVTFIDPVLFTGTNGLQIKREDRVVSREIPP